MGNKEKWVIQTSGLTLASSLTLRLSCPSSLSHYQVTMLAGLSLTFVFTVSRPSCAEACCLLKNGYVSGLS